jgi:hypothetical protein
MALSVDRRCATLTAVAKKQLGPKGGLTTKTPGGLQRVAVLLTEEQYAALRRVC